MFIIKENNFEVIVKYKIIAKIYSLLHWLKIFSQRLKYFYKVVFVWKDFNRDKIKWYIDFIFLFQKNINNERLKMLNKY